MLTILTGFRNLLGNPFSFMPLVLIRYLFAFAIVILSIDSYAQGPDLPLTLGATSEHQIKGGDTHSFRVEITAGNTARIEIEQKGVDVALAAIGPDGKQFLTSESPSGVLGSDLILVTAASSGVYRVNVTPSDPRVATGNYLIRLADVRPTTSEDASINEAAVKITRVADEATVLRQNGTRDGRRRAIAKFAEVIDLSRQKRDKVWETVALITMGLLYEQLGELQRSLDFYN